MKTKYKVGLFDAYGVCISGNEPNPALFQYWQPDAISRNTDLLDILAVLKNQGVLLFLATNCDVVEAAHISEERLQGIFDGTYASGAINAMKPSVAFFQHILDDLSTQDITKEDIVFFDDSPSNVAGAQHIGIDAFVYENADQVREVFGLT